MLLGSLPSVTIDHLDDMLPFGQYQIIFLGGRGICVKQALREVDWNGQELNT